MTVAWVIAIWVGLSVRAATLNRVSSRQQKAIDAKNRKPAGMRMALEITTNMPANGALSPGLPFQEARTTACCPQCVGNPVRYRSYRDRTNVPDLEFTFRSGDSLWFFRWF